MNVLALGQPEWDVSRRFLDGVAHRNLDSPLDFAHVVDVRVELRAVACSEILLEGAELARHRIEDAGVLPPAGQSLLGTCAIAEQPLEDDAGIDLRRERLRRGRPRDRVRVRAAVAP